MPALCLGTRCALVRQKGDTSPSPGSCSRSPSPPVENTMLCVPVASPAQGVPCLSPLQSPASSLQDEWGGEQGPEGHPSLTGGQQSPRSSPGGIQTSFAGAQAGEAAVPPSPAVFWVNFCLRQHKSIPPAAPVLLGDVARAVLPHLPQIVLSAANESSTKTPLQELSVSGDWDQDWNGQTHLSSAPALPSPAAFVSSSCSV